MTKQVKKILDYIYTHPEKLGHLLGYNKLTSIHGEWVRYVYLTKEDNTLQAHRGSYKTTSVIVVGIIWCLLFNPNMSILLASSTHENAKKILNEVKAQYNKEELISLYRLLGCDEPKDANWWTKESFKLSVRNVTKKEGSCECIGVGATITSRHYDKILCDDIVTLKDRVSAAERESKKQWIKELQSIINPGKTISYIGTPWHPQDIYSITPPARKHPVGTIKISGLTKERIAEIRRLQGESFFAAQYELKHIADEDRLFDSPMFKDPDFDTHWVMGFYDPSINGKDGDYNAIVFGRQLDGILWLTYAEIWRSDLLGSYDRVEKLCKGMHVRTLYVESNAAQAAIAIELKRRTLPVAPIHNHQNKHVRIQDIKKHWDKIMWGEGVQDEFTSQVLDYNIFAEHDDAPDALAGLVQYSRLGGMKLSPDMIGRSKKKVRVA